MQLQLNLGDHVAQAQVVAKRVHRDAELFLCRHTARGGFVTYDLSERYYPGVEVEWTTHMRRLSVEQAADIAKALDIQYW